MNTLQDLMLYIIFDCVFFSCMQFFNVRLVKISEQQLNSSNDCRVRIHFSSSSLFYLLC